MNLLGGRMAAPAAEVDRDLEQALLGLADGSYVLSTPDGAVAESGVGVVGLLGTPADALVGRPIAEVLVAGADPQAVGDFEQMLRAPHVDPASRPTFRARCANGATRTLQFVVVSVPLALGWEFTSLLTELRSRDAGTWHPEELRLRHDRALEAVEGVVVRGTQPDPDARLAGILIVVRDVDAPPLTREDVDRRMADQRVAARAAAADEARRRDEAAGRLSPDGEDEAAHQAPGLEDLVERARILRERVEDAERDAAAATAQRDEALARLTEAQAERDAAQAHAAGLLDAEARVQQLAGERDEARARLEARGHELLAAHAEVEAARVEAATTQAELQAARAAADVAGADVESARAEAQSARAEAQAARAEAHAAQAEAQAASAAAEAAQAEARSAQADAEAARHELEALRAQAVSVGGSAQSAQAEAEAALAEAATARAEADRAHAEAESARAEAHAARGVAETSRAETAAAREEATSAHADAERLRAELLAMREAAHDERAAHSENAGAELAALRAEADAAHGDAEALRAELHGARTELNTVRGETALARGEASAVRAQLESTHEELHGSRAELDALGAEIESLRTELEARSAALEAKDADLERAHAELEATRAAAEDVRAEREQARVRAQQLTNEAEQARAAAEAIRAEFAFDPIGGNGAQQQGAPARRTPWSVPAPTGPAAADTVPRTDATRPELPAVGPGEAAALIALDGSFKRLDESFCSLLGCREEDLRAARWPSIIDRENLAAHQEIARALKSGEIQSAEVETVYMHAQGLLVPIAGTISMHRPAPSGEPHFLFRAEVSRTAGAR